VDSYTKKGTVKRGFTLLVESPMNNMAVPFSVWSGGEGQRLRLAGTLGLMDFIHTQRGTTCNIEIFDEPTQFLSEEGIQTLLETLFHRARILERKIFIIDHRQFKKFGHFSGIISVVKSTAGSEVGFNEVR
jgi:DNA repair exonuclease SbcCD ATPase subunit